MLVVEISPSVYLQARTWDQKAFGWFSHLQPNFATKAEFHYHIVLRPNPPSGFSFVIFPQLTLCIFLFSSVEPYIKPVIFLSTSLQMESGRLATCMVYPGMDSREALANVILPANDGYMHFLPLSLRLINLVNDTLKVHFLLCVVGCLDPQIFS